MTSIKRDPTYASEFDIRAALAWIRFAAALLMMVLTAQAYAAPTVGIVSPQNKETVHDNRGRIAVSVELGHEAGMPGKFGLQALVDGRAVGEVQKADSFTLHGIDRGTHTLQVQLLGRDGEVLATSRSVEFHMWQASRLFPNRR